jgi:hypothetical protein
MRDVAGSVRNYIAGCSQTAGGVPIQTIAGATEDNVKVTGFTIDRKGTTNGSYAMSCELAVVHLATLANTKSLSFSAEYQTSADASSWDTAVVLYAATTVDTGDGVSTEFTGTKNTSLDLSSLKRYVRFNVTPNLSNTATDVTAWMAVATLGGYASSEDAEG